MQLNTYANFFVVVCGDSPVNECITTISSEFMRSAPIMTTLCFPVCLHVCLYCTLNMLELGLHCITFVSSAGVFASTHIRESVVFTPKCGLFGCCDSFVLHLDLLTGLWNSTDLVWFLKGCYLPMPWHNFCYSWVAENGLNLKPLFFFHLTLYKFCMLSLSFHVQTDGKPVHSATYCLGVWETVSCIIVLDNANSG